MTILYQSKGRIPVCWSAGRSPEAPRLTPGCGVLVGRSPAASSPASRCSSSKRRESSQRSRCGAETRCRPEETGDKTKAAPRRRLAETLGTNASRLGLWDDGVTSPRSTRRSRRPRRPPAGPLVRYFPPCCAVGLPLCRPSAAPPPYSG